MIVFFALLLIWIIVTLIGHLSWLAVSAVFRAIFQDDAPPAIAKYPVDDVAAAHRVISRMAQSLLISPQDARQLRRHIEQLESKTWQSPSPTARRRTPPTTEATVVSTATATRDEPSEPETSDSDQAGWEPLDAETPVAPAMLRANDVSAAVPASTPPVPTASRPAATPARRASSTPRASLGRSLAEFLAEHNIRWGELIAGLLIVVCSIGLVLSLWTTIAGMHRVIPSLIFLTGNASIFGAGLYTLFRWRLEDTSRATLVIAMLLVPLGILTGLSTAGIDAASVMLDDPTTILSILVAGAIYITLIWHSSKALVGTSNAVAMTIGVAGPAAVLPLVPAAIRAWDLSAAWVTYAGSAAVAVAITWMITRNRTLKGNAAARRGMVIGVTSFSLAVLAGYVAFMLQESETGWLSIAIATLPGVIVLAAASGSLAADTNRPKLALAGSVLASIGLLAASVILIPAMASMGWLWTWALSFSIAGLLAATLLGSPRWTVIATLPVGLAFLFSSSSWGTELPWSELPMWRRLLGGEPMLASMTVGFAVLATSFLIRDTGQKKALTLTSTGWLGYATINATILTVAPKSLMGLVEPWVFSAILGTAAVVIVWIFRHRSLVAPANLLAGLITSVNCVFWLSVLKPLVVGQPFPGFQPLVLSLLATAVSGIVAAELLIGREPIVTPLRSFASAFLFATAVLAPLLVLQLGGDLAEQTPNMPLAIGALLTCLLGWLWIGLTDRKALHLALARSFLVVTAVVVGHCYFHDALMTTPAWRNGSAFWSWAALGWSLVAAIGVRDLAIRLMKTIPQQSSFAFLAKRCDWYAPERQPWDAQSRELTVQLSTIFVALASMIAWGSLVIAIGFEFQTSIYRSVGLPIVVLVASGIVLHMRAESKHTNVIGSSVLQCIHFASLLAWLGWQVAIRILVDPAEQLVLATSLASIGCFALDLLHRDSKKVDAASTASGWLTGIGLAFIAVSSIALLTVGWVPTIVDGLQPDRFITLSIAAWWTVGAVTSAWLGYRYRSTILACASAVLVPAIVVLLMPLAVPEHWWTWPQSAAIASGAFAVTLWWIDERNVWKETADGTSRPFWRHAVDSFGNRSGDVQGESTSPAISVGHSTRGLQPAIDVSLAICTGVGVASCIALILGILRHDGAWIQLHNPAGLTLAAITAGLMLCWGRFASPAIRLEGQIAWPLTLSLTSGHLTMLLMHIAPTPMVSHRLLPIVWIGVALVAMAEYCRTASTQPRTARFNCWHAGMLVIASSVLCMIDGSNANYFIVGLVACLAGGILVTIQTVLAHWEQSRGNSIGKRSSMVTRGLCWYVLLVGEIFVYRLMDATSGSEWMTWTLLIGWIGSWALIWRIACPDRGVRSEPAGEGDRWLRGMLTDSAISAILLASLILETVRVFLGPVDLVRLETFADPLLWVRLGFGVGVAMTVCFRYRRKGMLDVAIAIVLVSATLLGLRLGIDRIATPKTLATIICLVVSSQYVVLVFASGGVCKVINAADRNWTGLVPTTQRTSGLSIPQFARALIRVGTIPLVVVLGLSSWMLVQYNSSTIVPVAICGVAMLAASSAELAERTGREIVRHIAMVIGLTSIAMWASVNVAETPMPLLTLSTRWFVGCVFSAAALAFLLPKLLGEQILQRWRGALRSGLAMSLSLAVASLLTTLLQEGMVRLAGQTDLLVKPLFLGMAATLAMLSLMCTLAGILSGPGYSYRDAWQLSDRRRTGLIIAAQVFGGLTWFHLFLCKSPLASLGLRAYWPYVVMTLSFASVGITEWARRRGDALLTKTLKQTALFLPLIPVIGFWMSGSLVTSLFGESDGSGWTYIQGHVSYQALLIAAALYYAVVSFLWKSGRARVVSIVIGNMALWVILIQTPNWDFLAHPQAWLIPPALCVLVATHFHRESLGSSAASGIRYAATLTIYITSTADMLVQGVGSTIMGPIVLILLALLGAGAGVALRVRPFLYLGATFVFIGVTSMVWYAQNQIDAVWPWWVFGISTGVALMIGLMTIEKNKPELHRIATSMQQWEP